MTTARARKTKRPKVATATVATLAKLFNLTERRVRGLGLDGIIPRPQDGKYDLVGAVQGYVKYLQKRAEGRSVEGQDVHAERAQGRDRARRPRTLLTSER